MIELKFSTILCVMATANSINGANASTLPSLPLQDRVAIVTGSSRGIGKAIAIHLAALGAKLAINYTSNKDQADLVASKVNSCSPDNNDQAIVGPSWYI